MNHIAREQRIGLLSVLAALVLTAAWWLLLMPAASKYKAHRQEARLKEKLGSIRPPDGGKPSDIQITRVPKFDYISATRLDPATLDCIAGEAYYRNEFTNAGFSYSGEKVDPKQHTKTLSFSVHGYDASVLCWDLQSDLRKAGVQSDVRTFIINMWGIER